VRQHIIACGIHCSEYATKRIKTNREKSPQSALPVLAVYMGHKEYKYTTRYLRVLDAGHRRLCMIFQLRWMEKDETINLFASVF